jgi:hypothetical protein
MGYTRISVSSNNRERRETSSSSANQRYLPNCAVPNESFVRLTIQQRPPALGNIPGQHGCILLPPQSMELRLAAGILYEKLLCMCSLRNTPGTLTTAPQKHDTNTRKETNVLCTIFERNHEDFAVGRNVKARPSTSSDERVSLDPVCLYPPLPSMS